MQSNRYTDHAREALAIEIEGLHHLHHLAGEQSFAESCQLLQSCKGKVVVLGVGKSGHIGRKISATFASVGFPAFFVHAAEALHGDLGMLSKKDVALILSYSGSSDEITNLLPALRDLAIPIIAITGNPASQLAKAATVHLHLGDIREACPHNLAPTTSTTAMLALGDMLAMALLRASGGTKEDFARSHPAGRLGKRLRLTVADLMQRENLPLVTSSASLMDTLLAMSASALGIAGITDAQGNLVGVFTDGDVRRSLQKDSGLINSKITEMMTRNFFALSPEIKLVDALEAYEQRKITVSFVLQQKHSEQPPTIPATPTIVGVLHMHAILRSGI